MLGGVKLRAHLLVALSIVIAVVLALWGLIGESHRDEKIEQLLVVVSPAGEDGVRITETIDQDFGTTDRHGPQLIVPNDLGVPTDVTAASDTAPDAVDAAPAPWDSPVQGTRIRVGDPATTVRGQHRYAISYVLPDARFAGTDLFLDVVGADSDIPIERVTVVFDGIVLDRATCAAGSVDAAGGCELQAGPPQTVRVARLDPREGITVSGEVASWTTPAGVDVSPQPEQREDRRTETAIVVGVLGLLAAAATYLWSVRSGANQVLGASAAEAAHGVAGPGPGTTRTVSDAELADLATIEFAPPKGIEPWQGAVALTEVLDDSLVTAWFSGAIAAGVLDIERHEGSPRLSRGPKAGEADAATTTLLTRLFSNREVVDLDGYDRRFAEAWDEVATLQAEWVRTSGWWWSRVPTPGRGKPGGCATFSTLVIFGGLLILVSGFLLGLLGVLGGPVSALVVGVGLPAIVARVAYAPLRPGRTANGSAYALQVESFRRFLVDSEAQHVEWAWEHGLIRQYSAWAVALDAADAWQEAMERSGIPRAEIDASTPLLVHSMRNDFATAHVKPAPPSSGGSSGGSSFSSGGFSGSVGGGGGGGSHGSW